ncbi:MAG: hypothetical protein ABH885_06800 [Candidatus Omnitrophota bacterium]
MKYTGRRVFVLMLAAVFCAGAMTGCASLRKKFIRKKKEKEETPQYLGIKEYKVTPSIELYKKHYIYWRSWNTEINENLGDNPKNDLVCIRQMIGNLEDMRGMLVDEKGNELDRHIDTLKGIEKDMSAGRITPGQKTRVQRVLKKEFMMVKINFTYTKMEPYMRSAFRPRYGSGEPEGKVE